MIGRIVEIAEDGRHLSLSRGFLVVEERGKEIGRVALDDIAVVMANAHGLTYTNTEPRRVSRRPHFLRGWGHHDETGITQIRP